MYNEILDFLGCSTPVAWVEVAQENLDLLLIDHAHCEKKAASSAISLISQYPHHTKLLASLSRLAREEMRHFESVLGLLKMRNMAFVPLTPGRYARTLHKHRSINEEDRLIDSLLIAAFIEARSCERFFALQNVLPQSLKAFYARLCQAEARHYQTYIDLAQEVAKEKLSFPIEKLRKIENQLILEKDSVFRFHSGTPS